MVILFDIDGTLINHDAAEAVAVTAMCGRMGLYQDAAAFLRLWRSAFERHYQRYLSGELSIQEQRRERFREVIDSTLSDDAADRMSASYIDDYLAACGLFSDAQPALTGLSGHRMGIISNGDRRQQHHKLARAGIDHHFECLILSAECGMAKPAQGIFDLACKSMDVLPAQAVYVGDRLDIDAEAARAAGLHGIWLDRLGIGDDLDSRRRISSLAELPASLSLIDGNPEGRLIPR